MDIDCGNPGPFNPMHFGDIVSNIIQGAINCDYVIMSNSTYTSVLRNCFSMQVSCLSNDDFIGDVNILVYVFIGVAVAVFTLGYFQISLFQAACERQARKIRLAFYAAIVRQVMVGLALTPREGFPAGWPSKSGALYVLMVINRVLLLL